MDFTYIFSCLGAWAGFDYCYVSMIYDEIGEGPSAYDPGWGDSKYVGLDDDIEDINEKIKQIVDEMIEEFEDSYQNIEGITDEATRNFYRNMTKEQYAENLKKILEILLNRDSKKDEIIE